MGCSESRTLKTTITERDAEINTLKKNMEAQERLLFMVHNVYQVKKEDLVVMDALSRFRGLVEDHYKSAKGKKISKGSIQAKMTEDGPIAGAFKKLWESSGGTDAGISSKDFNQLMQVILVHFNPAMYKFLLQKLAEDYPDEDNMPEVLDSLAGDWDQNKQPMESAGCDAIIDAAITTFNMKDGGLIPLSTFTEYFFKEVVKTDLLAPSWEYACWQGNITKVPQVDLE